MIRKISFLIAFLSTTCFGSGPLFTHGDTYSDQEFRNVYQDITSPIIGVGVASTMTITSLSVSTITYVSSATVRNMTVANLTVANLIATVSGTVVKISSVTQETQTTTTSSTYQSTALTQSITPSSASNKILIFVTGTIGVNGTSSDIVVFATIFRGVTNLANAQGMTSRDQSTITLADNNIPAAMIWLDAPASASSVTYTVKIKNSDNATTVRWNNSTSTTSMFLVELAI